MLPLYEAKMVHLYDTRWATYTDDGSVRDVTLAEKADPEFFVMPRYWVHETEIEKKLDGKWDKSWFLGWRDIARSTDERTLITTQLPRAGYGHKILIALPRHGRSDLQATWSSYVFDYVARQKVGRTSMSYFMVEQLPVPRPEVFDHIRPELQERVDRLNSRPTARVDRSVLRADLDGLMFRIYGVSRRDVEHIMETFPIIKRKDVAVHGEYRTKRLILESYDEWVANL